MGLLEFMETLQVGQVCPMKHGHPGQSIIYYIDRAQFKVRCQCISSERLAYTHGPQSLDQVAEQYQMEPKFNEWGEVCL